MDDDGGIETLALDRRGSAKLAPRDFHVVGLNRLGNIVHRQAVTRQLVRIEPNPHGVLAADSFHLPDARHAGDDLLHGGEKIISQVNIPHAAVFGDQAHHHQVVPGGFADRDPPALDFVG